MPFWIRAWLSQAQGVLLWGAFFGFFDAWGWHMIIAIHCHPTFKNIPVTPLDRRSMRIDRTKDQKSFHVATFFTVTFLLPCLQPVTALPTVWNCHRKPRASAQILNAEATNAHLKGACVQWNCVALCCCTNQHGFTSQRVRQLTYNIPFPKVVALWTLAWRCLQKLPMKVPVFLLQRWTKETSLVSIAFYPMSPPQLFQQPPSRGHSKSTKPQPQIIQY